MRSRNVNGLFLLILFLILIVILLSLGDPISCKRKMESKSKKEQDMGKQEQFWSHLRDSGLLSEEQVGSVRQRLGEAPSHILTSALVEDGLLTPFQVDRLWAGQGKGLVLGQYRILEELGQGGFGCVYKARHTLMNRDVALKVIAPQFVEDSQARARFRREVLATTQLQHPNIVLAYDADEVDDILFLAMEYVDGANLHALVQKQGPLPLGLACAMMHQAARALQYAHEKGMVHRDIKPANVLVPRLADAQLFPEAMGVFFPSLATFANTPLVKIVDFGLARLHPQRTAHSLTLDKDNGFIGTPDYVSPEQARNVHDVDIRADLYSLGCTFYFALTGQRPFKGQTALEIVVQHLEKEAEPLESFRPEVPPALAGIIRRLMAKKRAQRFQSPADLVAELCFLFGMRPMESFAPSPAAPANGKAEKKIAPHHGRSPAPMPPLGLSAETPDNAKTDFDNLPCTAELPVQNYSPEPGRTTVEPASGPAAADPTNEVEVPVLAGSNPPSPELQPPTAQTLRMEDSFRQYWQQWTAVVETLMAVGYAQVGEAKYRLGHGQLLETARFLADTTSGPRKKLFQRLVTLVEPWVTPQALAGIDRETLSRLQQRCQEFDRALGLGKEKGRFRPWLVAWVVSFVAAVVGFFLLAPRLRFPTNWAFSLPALWNFLSANPLLLVILLVPVVVLGATFVLARSSRS